MHDCNCSFISVRKLTYGFVALFGMKVLIFMKSSFDVDCGIDSGISGNQSNPLTGLLGLPTTRFCTYSSKRCPIVVKPVFFYYRSTFPAVKKRNEFARKRILITGGAGLLISSCLQPSLRSRVYTDCAPKINPVFVHRICWIAFSGCVDAGGSRGHCHGQLLHWTQEERRALVGCWFWSWGFW